MATMQHHSAHTYVAVVWTCRHKEDEWYEWDSVIGRPRQCNTTTWALSAVSDVCIVTVCSTW